MMRPWRRIPLVAAVATVVLCARMFAADPSLATLAPRLTQIATAARGEVGVSLFHVESGARLFSFNGQQPFAMASVYKLPIAFEMMGVAEPPPESEWTLDLQRELIDKVAPHELLAARARYTTDLRDTATPDDMAAFLLKVQRGELLPRPYTDLLLDLLTRVKTGPHRLKNLLPPETI